jgi:hypothetical protein
VIDAIPDPVLRAQVAMDALKGARAALRAMRDAAVAEVVEAVGEAEAAVRLGLSLNTVRRYVRAARRRHQSPATPPAEVVTR